VCLSSLNIYDSDAWLPSHMQRSTNIYDSDAWPPSHMQRSTNIYDSDVWPPSHMQRSTKYNNTWSSLTSSVIFYSTCIKMTTTKYHIHVTDILLKVVLNNKNVDIQTQCARHISGIIFIRYAPSQKVHKIITGTLPWYISKWLLNIKKKKLFIEGLKLMNRYLKSWVHSNCVIRLICI
jgi:hypothetical protein